MSIDLVRLDGRRVHALELVQSSIRLCRRCGLTLEDLVELERVLKEQKGDENRSLLQKRRW